MYDCNNKRKRSLKKGSNIKKYQGLFLNYTNGGHFKSVILLCLFFVSKSIEAMSYYRFIMSSQILCKLTHLYFDNDQPFGTKP